MKLQPYKFKPLLKTVIWGGDRIKQFKGIDTSLQNVGESWEVSGVEGHESIVDGGPDDGLSLSQLIAKYGSQLLGERVFEQYGNQFPLLVKLIDAHRDLSVQVHPNDALARRKHDCNGKTEMWYVIDHEPQAQIMAGFNRNITATDYDHMVADGTIMDAISHHKSRRGQVFFLPAGRIHAIGAGNFVAEIQQSSDVTYRVYDYNRLDTNGQPRELHTTLAREALDFTKVDEKCEITPPENAESSTLVACDYFIAEKHCINGSLTISIPDSFVILMCIDGSAEFCNQIMPKVRIRQGETLLIPACMAQVTLIGHATLLTAHC